MQVSQNTQSKNAVTLHCYYWCLDLLDFFEGLLHRVIELHSRVLLADLLGLLNGLLETGLCLLLLGGWCFLTCHVVV